MAQFKYRDKFNVYGIFGIILILLMIIVAFLLRWDINLLFFLSAISTYSLAIIILVSKQEYYQQQQQQQGKQNYESAIFNLWRVRFGCHCAFILLIASLYVLSQWLRTNDAFIIFGFFVASVTGGMLIPFMLFRQSR